MEEKTAHREAMLSNMAASLIIHKRITTTLQKAKALRSFVEPIITLTKKDSMHHRRLAFKHLQNKEAVKELFREIANKVADRPGGYTRILKTGRRAGDNAELCMMELVDYNELLLAAKEARKTTQGRTRRSRGKKADSVSETKSAVADEVVETKVEETKASEAKAEEPKTVEAKAEEAKVEEPKTVEAKAEEAKVEEPKAEETKDVEAKVADTKVEEPKAEDTNLEKDNSSEESKTE